MYPQGFEQLIALLEKLPGVGNKTAQRYAFSLLDSQPEDIERLAEAMSGLKNIRRCRVCGFLTDEEECLFCRDDTRRKDSIMVLAYPQDVAAIERTGSYKGQYHVLNGLISSSKGTYPEDLNIDGLLERISPEIKEIIIATSPTMDGETTALYLNKILSGKGVLVTRLAHGLPMGASLDYADDLTLIKAMNNRRKIADE